MKQIHTIQDLLDMGFKVVSKAYLKENNLLGFKHLKINNQFNSSRKDLIGEVLNTKLNTGKWVYAIVSSNGEILKTGKAECKGGITGRLGSYLSGNPKYNENDSGKPTNASTNRRAYKAIVDLLNQNLEVEFLAYPVPVEYKEEKIWDVTKIVPKQNVQQFEQVLYEKLNLSYTLNGKPKWNRENKAFKS